MHVVNLLADSLWRPRLNKRRNLKSQLTRAKICDTFRSIVNLLLFVVFFFSGNFSFCETPTSQINIPVAINEPVEEALDLFLGPARDQVSRWLERSHIHLPQMKRVFQSENLPDDLVYLTLIESGLVPSASSPAQAVGPWQFILETGKRHGLKRNWWLDERRDFEKSTRAAARYLKSLYNRFGDWHLALAGYNMGENGLSRKLKQTGATTYWEVREFLPLETQEYVPRFLAIVFISKSPKTFGFSKHFRPSELTIESIKVKGGTELSHIADTLGVSRSFLKNINAELILGHIPLSVSEHEVRVPKGAGLFLSKYRAYPSQKLAKHQTEGSVVQP